MSGWRWRSVASGLSLRVRRLGWFYGAGLAISMAALLGFAQLADVILEGKARQLNLAVLQSLHARSSPFWDRLALALTMLGSIAGTTLMTSLAAVFFLWRRRLADAATLVLAVLGGGGLVTILKHSFQQPRPELFESLAPAHGFSFPSGHALLSVCLYGYLAAVLVLDRPRQRLRWLGAATLVLLALAIGWSRLYLGVHWLSDVAAGMLAAAFWLACCLMAQRFAQTRSASGGRRL